MIYLQLTIMAFIWGGTFIAGRIVGESVGAFSAALTRFTIASICLLVVTQRWEGKLPPLKRKQWLPVLMLGLSGVFFYNVFFFLGLQTVTASRAALIVALNPIAIALASAVVFQDRLSPLKLFGITLSLMGATIVISDGNPTLLLSQGLQLGDLFLIGCLFSWAIYTIIGKKVMSELSPVVSVTYACIIGAMLLLPFGLWEGYQRDWFLPSPQACFALAYLGVFGSALGFCWYYIGIQKIGASQAAIFINFVPIAATILGALILSEPVTSTLVTGGGLVITGVIVTNRAG
ncbi:MAG: DMT family transporter [Halothece sp. Uz-M2-17]|nr:DMT family transporter [Halothece sp. Uz-M2-17]